MITNIGTQTFNATLESHYMHIDGMYNVTLKDKSGSGILIDSIKHIEELELLLKEVKERWRDKLIR